MQESTDATNWTSVAVGNFHSCALKSSGTVWCWGIDDDGELGNGATTGNQISPVQESTAATNWNSISGGQDHTCATKTTGTLWCWGADTNGLLGNGAGLTGDQVSPTQESTTSTNWASVAAGNNFTCAAQTNGTLWCWGQDGQGQLGNGAGITGDQVSPVQAGTDTDWLKLAVGNATACAIKTSGTLWCWGMDIDGELGNGSGVSGNQVSPYQAGTDTDWSVVAVGATHACGIKSNGTLWCWGNDADGQIGNGATSGDQTSPVQESSSATNWASVAAALDHTCATKTNGTLWCWGDDTYGQLGNGATTGDQISPVQESTTANDWAAVSARRHNTCARKADGTVWCWGETSSGQIGAGLPLGFSPISITECLNPQLNEGALIYNSSNNVMQYCDGVSWVRIGK